MSRDLLGDDVPDPPPMTAPLPWRVFCMSDQPEWYVARSLEEAKQQAAQDWAYATSDPEFIEMVADAYELSDEQLLAQEFRDEETGAKITFRAELDRMVARGLTMSGFFAGADY